MPDKTRVRAIPQKISQPIDFGPLHTVVYSDGYLSGSDFVADPKDVDTEDEDGADEMEVDEEWETMMAKRAAKKKLPKVSDNSLWLPFNL